MTTVSVNPLTLRFSNSELERYYVEYRTANTLLTIDRTFLYFNLIIHSFFVALELVVNGDKPVAVVTAMTGLTVVLFQWALMLYKSSLEWTRNRSFFVVVFRAIRLVIFVYGSGEWIGQSPSNVTSMYKTLILRSGTLLNAWFAFGMPMPFREHVLVQVLSVALMAAFPGLHSCEVMFSGQESRKLFERFWRTVDNAMTLFAGAPVNTDLAKEFPKHTERFACAQLVFMLHLVVGLLVPSMVLWQLECVSRRSFAAALSGDPDWSHITFDGESLPEWWRVGILLCVSFAGLWVLVTDVIRIVWGDAGKLGLITEEVCLDEVGAAFLFMDG